MGGLRERVAESQPRGSLDCFYEGISSWFPLANHFEWPGSQVKFGDLRILPCVCACLLAKMDFTEKASG